MVPVGNVAPGACDVVRVTEQLSVAVGAVHVTIASQDEASVFCVMLDGIPEITGFSLSEIVTSKLEFTELPAASVAV